ncbi:hypothetical protein BgiBS90_034115, partial [Biomphalaria glabrata]
CCLPLFCSVLSSPVLQSHSLSLTYFYDMIPSSSRELTPNKLKKELQFTL